MSRNFLCPVPAALSFFVVLDRKDILKGVELSRSISTWKQREPGGMAGDPKSVFDRMGRAPKILHGQSSVSNDNAPCRYHSVTSRDAYGLGTNAKASQI